MGLVVVDASVLIAFLDAADTMHETALAALGEAAREHEIVVPAVAYAEVMVGAFRGRARAIEVADRFFATTARVEPLSESAARLAAEIRARRRIRLPDALILATGIDLNADRFLTSDRSWKAVDRRVRVVARRAARRGT